MYCNLFYDFTTINGTETRKPNTNIGIQISEKIFFQGPLRKRFKAEANECRYKYIVKKQSNPIFKRWRLYRPDPTHSHIIQLSFASQDPLISSYFWIT